MVGTPSTLAAFASATTLCVSFRYRDVSNASEQPNLMVDEEKERHYRGVSRCWYLLFSIVFAFRR